MCCGQTAFGLDASIIALLGAGLLVLSSGLQPADYSESIEWETLLFFSGLFIMVGALVKTGVIAYLAKVAGDFTNGNALVAVMFILVVSASVAGVIDNIPYVTAMSPFVADLTQTVDPAHVDVLWWSLALGVGLGGNVTAVGASANVVALGIAARVGKPIGFWQFARIGATITPIVIAITALYLWLRYFVWA